MNLAEIENGIVDGRTKGLPPGLGPMRLGDIGKQGWNLLREDLPLPAAVLKRSALDQNSRFMRLFLDHAGVSIAPHGKTTMSPQLFARQLDDGAWAITLATAQQVRVARTYGCARIVLANQLVGRQAIHYALNELKSDPGFDFYCLVNSVENVTELRAAAAEIAPGRPLKLLLEGGYAGGRTGCRDLESALAVARAIKAAAPHLALVGVEGFEGIIHGETEQAANAAVARYVDLLVAIAEACDREDLFAPGEALLSAGGSAYYDIVADRFKRTNLRWPTRILTRSGCYLTHDAKMYADFFAQLRRRDPEIDALGVAPVPALEVWAAVQSRPEREKAILTLGKRDVSYDAHLPLPFAWARPGARETAALGPGHRVTGLNDQHCHMQVPADLPLQVGDLVGFGISHPCLTFDKWQVMTIVDDFYTVIDAIRTFF